MWWVIRISVGVLGLVVRLVSWVINFFWLFKFRLVVGLLSSSSFGFVIKVCVISICLCLFFDSVLYVWLVKCLVFRFFSMLIVWW